MLATWQCTAWAQYELFGDAGVGEATRHEREDLVLAQLADGGIADRGGVSRAEPARDDRGRAAAVAAPTVGAARPGAA